jgi:hypothetical protein
MNLTTLIIQLISGALGGSAAGNLSKLKFRSLAAT